jgi:hypothetical protein
MYEYKVNILKVVDGDTVDVDIDLGFGVWLRNERVRIGDKEAVQAQHLKNRQRLIDEGKVPTPDGMTLTPNKVNTFKATKPPLRKKKNKKK